MKKLTEKQNKIIASIANITGIHVDINIVLNFSNKNIITLDVNGFSDNQINEIIRAGHFYKLYNVEPNGYKKIALTLK